MSPSMEMNKVIRIIAVFTLLSALAIRTVTWVMYDAPIFPSLPILVTLVICLGIIWHGTTTKENSKEK